MEAGVLTGDVMIGRRLVPWYIWASQLCIQAPGHFTQLQESYLSPQKRRCQCVLAISPVDQSLYVHALVLRQVRVARLVRPFARLIDHGTFVVHNANASPVNYSIPNQNDSLKTVPVK